ncbi:lipoyl synthase [Eubacteriaceae bacterium ES3]|nr:lipoyl synthase [Eubacteriaceae bacterium ES3]
MKKSQFVNGFFENKKKPDWLKVQFKSTPEMKTVKNLISDLSLNTICLEANCPNRVECYNRKTATFMILGRNCTRNCTFCNVTKNEPDPVDQDEARRIGEAVKNLGLRHAVITSVTRDDLPDQGAKQFAQVVYEIRKASPETRIELLIPDMQGQEELIDIVLDSEPDFLNHNIETIARLYGRVRPTASYQRSLDVIRYAKQTRPDLKTKSGMMLGLGETEAEVIETMNDLIEYGCDILTLGQYLQPSKEHLEIEEYISPNQFDDYKKIALELGFKSVASAPLVRSSYHADELDF